MFRSVLLAPLALLACVALALAGFPSSSQLFPPSSQPGQPKTVFQYCWPAGSVSAPCTSTASAPTGKAQPLSGTNTFTVITKITPSALNPFSGASNYVVSLLGLASATYHVDSAWIGQSVSATTCTTGSGKCSWDFFSPTQLTLATATAFTVPAAGQLQLDTVAGTLVSGAAYTLALDITGGTQYPTVTPNTTTFNTNPKACGTGNGCTYTSWATCSAGLASITGSISGTTLTVATIPSGRIHQGSLVTGAGVSANTIVTGAGSGSGGTGTYTVNNSQTVSPTESMTVSQAASLGKGAGGNTSSCAQNTSYTATSNIVGGLGTFSVQ